MTHGHDVLHMMEGNSYASRRELVEAIIAKFMPAEADGFTVDVSKVCNH